MNKILSIVTLFVLMVPAIWSQDKTIAVFDFENNGLDSSKVKILTDRLQSELVKIGGYRIVERSKIENILKEQKFQVSGLVEEEDLIDLGKILGAEMVLLGSFGKLDDIYTVSARLVDSETSEIVETAFYDTGKTVYSLLTVGMSHIASNLSGKTKIPQKSQYDEQTTESDETKNIDEIIENNNIKILSVKKKLSNDGLEKIYVVYEQKISYKPTEIMIDWIDSDGITFNGEKKYTKSKILKNETRTLSFYVPDGAFDYRIWLKK